MDSYNDRKQNDFLFPKNKNLRSTYLVLAFLCKDLIQRKKYFSSDNVETFSEKEVMKALNKPHYCKYLFHDTKVLKFMVLALRTKFQKSNERWPFFFREGQDLCKALYVHLIV